MCIAYRQGAATLDDEGADPDSRRIFCCGFARLPALEYPAYLLGIDADALNQKLTR